MLLMDDTYSQKWKRKKYVSTQCQDDLRPLFFISLYLFDEHNKS